MVATIHKIPHPSETPQDEKGPTTAQRLLLLTEHAGIKPIRTARGELYLLHEGENGYTLLPLTTAGNESNASKRLLARLYHEEYGAVASARSINDALLVLAGRADGEPASTVGVRLASHEGVTYLDLAHGGAVAALDGSGWRIIGEGESPVLWRRPAGLLPLPVPLEGQGSESLTRLRDLLNIGDEQSWALCLGWLLAALRPEGQYPLLALSGEQGSGKSTAARLLRSTIDPSSSLLRNAPADARSVASAMRAGHVLAYDNLSYLPGWLSDLFCMAVTGGDYAARGLYTDLDEIAMSVQHPLLITGIPDLATRGDLLDRVYRVELTHVEKRRSEEEVYRAFREAHPAILGALLDASVRAHRDYGRVHLDYEPRMLDVARWLTAAEPALGLHITYGEVFRQVADEASQLALDADILAQTLLSYMESRQRWEGTASDLLDSLTFHAETRRAGSTRSRYWPGGPAQLSAALRRLAPSLRSAGIEWYKERDNKRTQVLERIVSNDE